MPLDQLTPYLPWIAIAAGVAIVLWGERGRLGAFVNGLLPSKADPGMSPSERFTTFHALRTWCEQAGEADAVKALDGQVLPAIVKGEPKP